MTIMRVVPRSILMIRSPSVNFNVIFSNEIRRNASILVVNSVKNDNFLLKDYRMPKISQKFDGQFVRNKFKKTKQQDEEEEELSVDFEDDPQDKHSKVMKVSINSLRADLVIKSGLGIARNKVEALFYESKIRVNGQKIDKKSARVDAGDEIDVIKGQSQMNPDHLVIQRVEILGVKPKDDGEGLIVSLRRHKSLTIENYEDPYKAGSED